MRREVCLWYEKYDDMGKRTISLPDEILMGLDLAAEQSGRTFSGEIRFRLAELDLRRLGSPTGVAENRVDCSEGYREIIAEQLASGGHTSGGVPVGAEAEALLGEIEKKLEPAKGAIEAALDSIILTGRGEVFVSNDGVFEKKPAPKEATGGGLKEVPDNYFKEKPFKSFMKGEKGKFEGVSELAKKIAKDVPGVKVASEFKAPAADEMPDLSKLSEPVISAKPGGLAESIVKSAKKRPVETEGRVELVKGFWRETFDSVGDAMVEVAQKGWKSGEYTIKPVEKLNTTKP